VNAYITPYPKAEGDTKNKREQGFAPHYDDIDAFLIQLEGAKQWNLLKPQHSHELLDIEPSKDYAADLVLSGKLHKYWSGLLKEGDLLYMPRGVIHYGKTQPPKTTNDSEHKHSLHITVSNQQHNSWADFLQAGI
jgi:lysine-specific demethylase/histidyl-hydroxylase NO66